MADQEVRLKISTDATRSVTAIGQVTNSLKTMERESATLTSRIKDHWLGMSAAIYGAYATIKKGWNLAEMAATFEQQKMMLNRLASFYGTTADDILSNIQRASDGTISFKDAVDVAGEAMVKKLKPDQLYELASAAEFLADISGKKTSEVFTNLTSAIATGRDRAIKGLVGIVDLETRYTSKQVANMSDVVKAQAKYEMVMKRVKTLQEEVGDAGDTTAKKMERFAVSVQNLQLHIGQGLIRATAGAAAGFLELAIAIVSAYQAYAMLMAAIEKYNPGKFMATQTQGIADYLTETLKRYGVDVTGGLPQEQLDKFAKMGTTNWKSDVEKTDQMIKDLRGKSKEMWSIATSSSSELAKALDPSKLNEPTKKLTDQWAILKDILKLDIEKQGLESYQQQLLDITQQVKDYKREWGTRKEFDTWAESKKWWIEFEAYLNHMIDLDKILASYEEKTAKQRIDHEKILYQERVKLGEYSTVQQIGKEMDFEKQLLEAEKNRIQKNIQAASLKLDSLEKTREILSLTKDLDSVEKGLLNVEELRAAKLKEYSMTISEGVAAGMNIYVDELGSQFRQGVTLAKEAAKAMESAFSDFFFDIITGKLQSLGDYVNSFLQGVARAISNTMAQQAAAGVISGGSTLLSMFFHEGGIVGAGGGSYRMVPAELFIGAPRLHKGLAQDEYAAILQRGETVIPKGSSPAIYSPNIEIKLENKSSQQLSVSQGPTKFEFNKMVITAVVDDYQRNGLTRIVFGK